MLTSLLARHPDCCHSAPKETNFFTLNFSQGWDWYRGTFAHYRGEPVIGEGSVSYASIPFRENVARRLHEYAPAAKIIYIVRHPYEKLISGWKMATSGPGFVGYESAIRGFESYVLHEEARHPRGGPWNDTDHGWSLARPSSESKTRVWLDALQYQRQMDNYRECFPERQLRVMFLEDWKHDPRQQAEQLCDFLDLDPAKLPAHDEVVNRADERRKLRGFANFLGNSSVLRPLRHAFPSSIRGPLRKALFRSRWGSKQHAYPDFHITSDFKAELIHYLRRSSRDFLEQQGKPPSFWNYDQLA